MSKKTSGQDGVVPGGHRENSDEYRLAVFKAQLGEPLLGILNFSFSFSVFSSFLLFLFGKLALKRAKPGLKQPNRHLKVPIPVLVCIDV